MQKLIEQLNIQCDEQPFETGWYLKNLRSGEIAQRNGEVVYPSASTRKISIMMAALKAVNENRLALDQPVTIEAKYQNNKSGTFQHFQPGFTVQFRDVLAMMIIVSDNTRTGTIVDMLGLDEIDAYCKHIRMKNTIQRWGRTSFYTHGLHRKRALGNARRASGIYYCRKSHRPALPSVLGCIETLKWRYLYPCIA